MAWMVVGLCAGLAPLVILGWASPSLAAWILAGGIVGAGFATRAERRSKRLNGTPGQGNQL
jgi:hypothetical protein